MKKSILLMISTALLVSTAAFSQITTTCSTGGGTNCSAVIPDAVENTPGVVTSTIVLPAAACPASVIAVNLDIIHNYVGDLRVELVGPDDITYTLLDRPVTAGDCGSDDIVATFVNGGTPFPCSVTNPASGPGPIAPVTSMTTTVGQSMAGVWTLVIYDFANTGIGALNDWSLAVGCPATVTITALDGMGSESPVDPISFLITRTPPPVGFPSTDLTVFFTLSGTATGADYTPNPVSVVIPAGQNSATVVLTPVADGNPEGQETVIATIQPDAAYTVGVPSSAQALINDFNTDIPLFSPIGLALALLGLGIAGAFVIRTTSAS